MNTKYFFLLLLALLASFGSSSTNTNKKSNFVATDIQNAHEVIKPVTVPARDTKKTDPSDWEGKHPKSSSRQHHSEEDGKHHHIHFHRLAKEGKRKHLLLFIAKLVLIISHLSVLLFVFMHSIH